VDGLLSHSRLPGIWGEPPYVPRVVGGAPPFPSLPNPMNTVTPRGQRPPAAPPQAPGQSLRSRIGDGIGMALGGVDDPELTPEQNRAARSQAILMAGLAMLASNQPGLGAVAEGAMFGQQVGGQARQIAYMSTQEERLKQALQNPAIVGKLTEEQAALIQLLPPMEAGKKLMELAFAPKPGPIATAANTALVDPVTLQEVYRNTVEDKPEPLPADVRAALWEMGLDESTLNAEQRRAVMQRVEQMKRAGATTVNVNTERRQDFADSNTLATAFERDMGDYKAIASHYGTLRQMATDPTGASDVALIFAYMKILDPTSVVRESEYATAANAGSIPERVRAAFNKAKDGDKLSDVTRAEFIGAAERIATQKQREARPVIERYRSRAIAGGVDPEMVIYDPFAEIGEPDDDVLAPYLP
jgi:hypothetical protein